MIREHVGAVFFSRGKDYFLSGRASKVSCEKEIISGLVRGSSLYQTTIFLGDNEIADSECSCPMETACKHVAALGLKALPLINARESLVHLTPKPTQPSWAKQLERIEKKIDTTGPRQFDLQILLAIEQADLEDYYLFGSHDYRDLKVLSLRPRLFDPTDNTVSLNHARWDHGAYGNGLIYWDKKTGTLKSEAQFFLKSLNAALDKRLNTSWQTVTPANAASVWQALKDHKRFGVSLFAGKKSPVPVVVSPTPVDISLVIQEEKKAGAISLSRQVLAGEVVLNPKCHLLLGSPPCFCLTIVGSTLDLPESANCFTLSAVSGSAPEFDREPVITIPASSLRLFQKDHLPKLARHYNLKSLTGKFPLPRIITPNPVLTIEKIGRNKIALRLGQEETPAGNVLIDEPAAQKLRQEAESRLQKIYPDFAPDLILEGLPAARFVSETLPKLPGREIKIAGLPELPNFTLDETEAEINFNLAETDSDHDWFDLKIRVSVSGEDVPFSELFAALVRGESHLLLESGRYFSLSNPKFAKLKDLIAEAKSLQDHHREGLRLSHFQLGFWEELSRLGIVGEQAKRWEEISLGLKHFTHIDTLSEPPGFEGHLRPYQKEGFSYLSSLRKFNLGGILADDMGLGKTVQAICLILSAQHSHPFLILAPTSVVENWDAELSRFAPGLSKIILRRGDRSEHYQNLDRAKVVVCSYPLLLRDFDKLKQIEFDTIILDEAQAAKNHQSKVYSSARRLNAASKIALTGTPMENNLMELWSVISIVAPGLFPSPQFFSENFRLPIEKFQNQEALAKLRSRLRPFLLRRQKEFVEKDLPQKTVQTTLLEMNPEHRKIYNLHLTRERQKVLGLLESNGFKNHRFEILKSLTVLRQLCLDPSLVDPKYGSVSPTKIEAFRDQLAELLAGHHKALVFSQFTSFLATVRRHLDSASLPYLYLDGSTKNRGDLISKFQSNPDIPLFLISLKAGGSGLNLTAADYCLLLDPWWNPAVEHQAIDRTHRIGQEKPVFVYKYILKDSVEEKVLRLQEKKEALFKNVLEEGNLFSSLITDQDVREIFS